MKRFMNTKTQDSRAMGEIVLLEKVCAVLRVQESGKEKPGKKQP